MFSFKHVFLLVIILYYSIIGFSKPKNESIGYTFQISGINTQNDAKVILATMQDVFLIHPNFIDSTDTFTVPANQYLNELELTSKLNSYGFIVINFTTSQ